MTNAVLRFTSAVIVLLAMLACGPGAQTGEVTHLDADWAILYHDLGQLKLDSDLAVAGTFTSMSGQTEQTGIPYSDFVLTVNRTIYDPKHRPSTSTVLVHQTGGTVNGHVAQIADDPLFKVGERVVLFLHEYSPGRYFVVGGPSGRFELQADGTVRPFNDEGVRMTAMSEEAFVGEVDKA